MVKNILWVAVVGSHAWNMQTTESDLDVVIVHAAPIDDLLLGYTPRAKHKTNLTCDEFETRYGLPISSLVSILPPSVDITEWEIGMLLAQLKKGNMNATWVVLSPLVAVLDLETHTTLKNLLEAKPRPRAAWPSVNGMAHGTLRTGKTRKKLRIAMRMLHQFKLYIYSGKLVFNWDKVEFDIASELQNLERILGTLPEDPDIDAELDGFLLSFRKNLVLRTAVEGTKA